ncbi:TIGR04133 family radical SAM/SPASM protein [Porphyromonas circumdentaria]|uniref:TIGR04133 family radical SAM/SPASM protein n=1 Tax=Porphyromonas circumdentaria TaxID=29524 RepID=UPI0026DADD0A|nr:TIGR04133 family radical SAM/SPASM protein [Porphyromonas circumdentaria]MDO4722788.1 TIGR04133 family radical SAM/SPASM protein [Porphyromonas circumdentaria]
MSGSKITFAQRIGLERHRILRKRLAEEHPLRTLFWECTLRCNLACKHCGSDCHVSSNAKELSKEQFLSIIDSITPHVDPHKVLIIFTGGEALLRHDLPDIGRELYKREYPWGIVTNGMLLDESQIETLLRNGIHTLTISLDGFEEAHNYLRGHSQSYHRAERAVRLMAQISLVNWDVVTCVNPMNFSYLSDFRDHLIAIGLKQWRLFTIFPVGRAALDPNLQLSDEDFYHLMEFIRDTNREGKIKASYGCEGFLGGFEREVREDYYICNAGLQVASILCDGTISSCPSIRFDYKQGNALEEDFWEVWQKKFLPYRDRSWAKRNECSGCEFWRYCEGNGMHLHDDDGKLLVCHYKRLERAEKVLFS